MNVNCGYVVGCSSGAPIACPGNDSNDTTTTLRNISGHIRVAENNPAYEMFKKCFKEKADTPSCPSKNAVDFDKDGDVDEQDYRLFLESLNQ